jgi:hypothetical protein
VKYSPSDLTIVSGARIQESDSLAVERRRALVALHRRYGYGLSAWGTESIFVDFGSDPSLGALPYKTIRAESEIWNESAAKNLGLAEVQTRLVAFTNADTWVSANTVEKTLECVNREAGDKPFILQGYRWEVPRLLTRKVLSGEEVSLEALENFSVPHGYPKPPIGEWQVCPVEIARDIGGFDERMTGANSYGGMDTDFHERARALCLMRGGVEILTRKIPILHPYHYAERPYSPNRELARENITRFIQEGTEESLRWDSKIRSGAEREEVGAAA